MVCLGNMCVYTLRKGDDDNDDDIIIIIISPLYKVCTIMPKYLEQSISLGYIVLQLFRCYNIWFT